MSGQKRIPQKAVAEVLKRALRVLEKKRVRLPKLENAVCGKRRPDDSRMRCGLPERHSGQCAGVCKFKDCDSRGEVHLHVWTSWNNPRDPKRVGARAHGSEADR